MNMVAKDCYEPSITHGIKSSNVPFIGWNTTIEEFEKIRAEKVFQLNDYDEMGFTVLCQAAYNGNLEIIGHIVAIGKKTSIKLR